MHPNSTGLVYAVEGGVERVVVQSVSAGRPSDDTSTDVSPATIFTDAFCIFDYLLLIHISVIYLALCIYSAFSNSMFGLFVVVAFAGDLLYIILI